MSSSKQVPLPLAIDDENLETEQPPGKTALMCFYVAALRALGVSTAIKEQEATINEYQLLFARTELANTAAVMASWESTSR